MRQRISKCRGAVPRQRKGGRGLPPRCGAPLAAPQRSPSPQRPPPPFPGPGRRSPAELRGQQRVVPRELRAKAAGGCTEPLGGAGLAVRR